MADEQPQPVLSEKQQAIKAWHDAETAEKKKAAVTQFPILREMYSEAQYLV
jgi:hypothetical protein